MGFFGFLAKKNFYTNLGLSIILTIIIVLASLWYIRSYTRHGEALELDDFRGMTLEQLEENHFTDLFDFIVTDSVFSNELKPGSIIKQNPSPHSKVKQGRNIYIAIVAQTPEMTVMPDLKDLTVRQAVSSLKSKGLKTGKLLYIHDMADNAVLGNYYNGDTVRAGDELLSGSTINLLIGRSNNNPSPIPFLVGQDETSAADLIHISSFNVGRVIFWDSLAHHDGKVYLQSPEWMDEASKGDRIDIWLRSPTQVDFDSLIETLMPDTSQVKENAPELPEDSLIFEE